MIERLLASWFETQGLAALLTMRVWDLTLRSRAVCAASRVGEATEQEKR